MIVAAAIRQDGKVYSLPRPARHVHVMASEGEIADKVYGLTLYKLARGEQGFLDDAGNFLTREEAAKHALECGQITELKYQPDKLFSEDVW